MNFAQAVKNKNYACYKCGKSNHTLNKCKLRRCFMPQFLMLAERLAHCCAKFARRGDQVSGGRLCAARTELCAASVPAKRSPLEIGRST